ncbi:MAG: hypothetical protein ACYDBW_09220 [Sulfuricaulis sp.]
MKKSLTSLLALMLAVAFGTSTLAYAEVSAAKENSAASAKKEDMKTEKKAPKKHYKKKMKKKAAKKEKKEEMKEGK